jgi:UDP-N-acetylglucosamine 1-carboxyvinyltransferase
LADGEHIFHNVPDLKDVESALLLLEHLGCESLREGSTVRIRVTTSLDREAPYDLVRKMRASILCLGPLLTRYGSAVVSLPGGCAIGNRPINMHLEAMKLLGAQVEMYEGYVHATCKRLQGGTVLFDSVTVGGTENLLMAAVLAEGTTIIENAAKEPEIVDLANYLKKMGASIKGEGSSIITVVGVETLRPAEHSIIPDRIEAGTLLIAGGITGGHVTVRDCRPADIEPLVLKMRESGFTIDSDKTSVTVRPTSTWRGVDVSTSPHPGFPTDIQAQFMTLMTVAEGTSVITENIFENRFMHVQELVRLNAEISPKAHVAVVRGRPGALIGAPVMATDLRASACLVLAGLVARGETLVQRIYHLDRGYERLEAKLSALGAQVRRLNT